jgi:hypothetical protein
MPGPKKPNIAPVAGDGLSIVTAVEVPAESTLELPSVDGYRSERKRKVRTADGPEVETEYYWTKKNLSAWLAKCPKVSVHLNIDKDYGETNARNARPHKVYIDGHRIEVPKGRPVLVALPVALILQQMEEEYRTAQIQGIDLYLIDTNDAEYGGYETTAPAAG